MRGRIFILLQTFLLATIACAIQLPQLEPFLSALPNIFSDYLPDTLQNSTAHELLKRQNNNCPTHYNVCSQSPNLCCTSNAVCSVDQAGMVACCPSGKVCTGTITGVITGGTIDGSGGYVGATTASSNNAGVVTTTTSLYGYTTSTTAYGVPLTTTTTATTSNDGGNTNSGGFIIDGTSTVAAPNAARRSVDMPVAAQFLLWILQVLPL